MATDKNDTLAVLIDADNAQASITPELLAEVAQYGRATVKRAYGDWTTPNLKSWKGILHKHAIQPMQQFGYTTGKNSTDSSLIIDAMDLLHSGHFHGFCLVSSDSDFTRLATRLRESGAVVYGFGESKTPASFISACDKFIYTEILRPRREQRIVVQEGNSLPLERMLRDAIEATARDNGWSSLAAIGSMISKSHPSFDARNYGFSKLSELLRVQPYVELKGVAPSDALTSILYARLKQSGTA